jgi:paraquat-inducible protein B
VADISFDYLQAPEDSRIPVLVEIDPSLLHRETSEDSAVSDLAFLEEAVRRGLRASLKTGSLLTGSLFVDLDYYKEPLADELGKVGDYPSIPTISSGLAQLEAKLTAILDKVQALPLDDTLVKIGKVADEARESMVEVREMTVSLRKIVDSSEFVKLPEDLRKTLLSMEKSVASVGPGGAVQGDLLRTMDELRATLRSLNALSTGIDDKPSSLIFGRDSTGNPEPKAPKR